MRIGETPPPKQPCSALRHCGHAACSCHLTTLAIRRVHGRQDTSPKGTPSYLFTSRITKRCAKEWQASRQCLNHARPSQPAPAGFRRAECSRSLRSSDTLHTQPSSSPTTEAPLRLGLHSTAPHPVRAFFSQQVPSETPHAPPPHSAVMFRSSLPPHHCSAPRAASGREPQVLSSPPPALHPVPPLLLTSSLRSFLAAWTPPPGSLDPHALQQPSR